MHEAIYKQSGAKNTSLLATDVSRYPAGISIMKTDYIPLELSSHGPGKLLQDLENDCNGYAGVKTGANVPSKREKDHAPINQSRVTQDWKSTGKAAELSLDSKAARENYFGYRLEAQKLADRAHKDNAMKIEPRFVIPESISQNDYKSKKGTV